MAFKLMSIEPSDRAGKKWQANFFNRTTNEAKTVHFGAKGYTDLTLSGDEKRAELYRQRHLRDLSADGAETGMTPGALSFFVLWTSPNMAQGIRNFKNMYSL